MTIFKDNTSGARALRVGPDGRLYAAHARQRIVSYGPAGDEKVVAQNVDASDLAITAKGDIYFPTPHHKTIGYIDAKGQTRTVYDGGEIAHAVRTRALARPGDAGRHRCAVADSAGASRSRRMARW